MLLKDIFEMLKIHEVPWFTYLPFETMQALSIIKGSVLPDYSLDY